MKQLMSISAAAFIACAASAQAQDLDFLLVNDSSANLIEFNVSTTASDSWEENLLEGGYLAPGYEITVQIADGEATCFYDIRGIFDDGSDLEDYDLDLCDLGEYVFYD